MRSLEQITNLGIIERKSMAKPVGEGMRVCLPLEDVKRLFCIDDKFLKEQGIKVVGACVIFILPHKEDERKESYDRLCQLMEEEAKEILPEEKAFLLLRTLAYWVSLKDKPKSAGHLLRQVA